MKEYLGFGIAGNFANHLEQAGEASDFANVVSDEDGAPKGMFPFYIPRDNTFLGRYCIDNKKIILPKDSTLHAQAEPEIGLECEVIYEDEAVKSVIPKFFMAFDDTSIRNDSSAKKISQKKNFSSASKGCGFKIPIDKFEKGGVCDNYSLTSFLIFDGKAHQYGDNAKLTSYTYFYKKLVDWIVKKINTQEDHAVLENLNSIIKRASFPSKILIAVGATSYTKLAEERFLQEGDEVCVVAYNHNVYTNEKIKALIEQGALGLKDASIVRQEVVREY